MAGMALRHTRRDMYLMGLVLQLMHGFYCLDTLWMRLVLAGAGFGGCDENVP